MVGSSVGSKEELQLLVDLRVQARLKGVANSKHRLNEVNEVLTALKEGKVLGRAYFDPFFIVRASTATVLDSDMKE